MIQHTLSKETTTRVAARLACRDRATGSGLSGKRSPAPYSGCNCEVGTRETPATRPVFPSHSSTADAACIPPIRLVSTGSVRAGLLRADLSRGRVASGPAASHSLRRWLGRRERKFSPHLRRRPNATRGPRKIWVTMAEDMIRHLRVLIANEKRERLELLAQVVAGLGHEVIAREIYVKEVGAVTARERPDVALVGLGLHSEHALELISEIVREASCPVIALLSAKDPAYVHEAAKRGVFAYIVDSSPEELQNAIDITLQRFAEYHSLQGAFGRRAMIEQAKGILMARHAIDADRAFDMLRDHSQHNGHKLVDVAQAIVDSHLLLLPPLPQPATPSERPA
jgi:AmiR/NasT family two-component response regulator